ncbi:hypothetical protein [Absidia glauca]|uniref:Uncharacterized protein n=1 Tax=Absidia glauca TaxID=4829 RepID=A0A163JJZ9_ABSGL|nr:hypothetical protein [Absidia glauca]
MPKYNKDSKAPSKPYTRSTRLNKDNKKSLLDVKKKPITKSEKVKNADLTSQLDNLMDDLSSQLSPPKKNKQGKKLSEQDKILEQRRVEEEQRRYEQTQTDMDDALGLLTKL